MINQQVDLKVAIYHFTDKSEKRPIVYQKQMDILRAFASQFGAIEKEYLDMTLKQCEQIEKKKMLQEIGQFDILATKDFYHIAKNTGTCISLMQQLLGVGVEIHSIEDGCFIFTEVPFNKELNVAIYHSKYVDNTPSVNRKRRGNSISAQTHIDIMKLFVKSKTNWKITGVYIDEAQGQSDDKQVELLKLIENSSKYDLVLCKDFNTVHWRTAKFCKRRNDMQLPIYSLKEGYLEYGKE